MANNQKRQPHRKHKKQTYTTIVTKQYDNTNDCMKQTQKQKHERTGEINENTILIYSPKMLRREEIL